MLRYSSFWRAPLVADKSQNLLTYYFKIALTDKEDNVTDVVWYSSLGMSREPPLMQHCYALELFNTHPQWAIDSIVYQIFPDKFASSKGAFNVDGTRVETDAPIKTKDFEFEILMRHTAVVILMVLQQCCLTSVV